MTGPVSAKILLTGALNRDAFPVWIARHAEKLGLADVSIRETSRGIEVTASGVEEMLQALALGASLGPKGVLVETMDISTYAIGLRGQ